MTGIGEPALDFLTKEPVEGVLLSERMAQSLLSDEEAAQYAIEIGSQLHQAHSRGMIHGCLCPDLICITASGAQVLAPSHRPVASAAYRSPEQVRGKAPDARSDIFAFGAIVYEMAAGTPAFLGEGAELNRSLLEDPAPTLTLRSPIYDAMARVVAGCLEKNPAARRQRIQNAVLELRFGVKTHSILAGRQPGGSRPAAAPAAPRFAARMQSPTAGSPEAQFVAGSPEAPFESGAGFEAVMDPVEEASGEPPVPTPPPPGRRRSAMVRPRVEEFFYRPGEPVLKPKPAVSKWQAVLEGTPTFGGFRVRLWAVIGVSLLLLAGVALAATLWLRPRASAPVVKFAVAPPEHTSYPGSPTISPDGRMLVFSAQGPEGQRMLWLRPLDAMRHSPINGTEGATNPFWSPDGQYLAYFSGRALKTVRIKDGLTETICKVEGANGGGAWNIDGTILFSRNPDDGLYKVAAKANSNPTPVLRVNAAKGENSYMWPQFLPDGKHFLFYIQTEASETSGVYAASLDSPDYRLLFPSETNALYSGLPGAEAAKSGYLLFIANRKLMGQAFNPPHLALTGEPVTLAEDIGAIGSMNLAPITVANNGTLAYQSTGKPTRQLRWTDRSGTELAAVHDPGTWGVPRIAPNGRYAAVGRVAEDGKTADIWLVDNDGSIKPLSHQEGASEGGPVWSPDGTRIAFWVYTGEGREGNHDIYVRSIESGAKPDLLFRSSFPKYPTDWSRDGRYIFFHAATESTKDDIWGLSTGDRHAAPILDTVADEQYAALSPDGKWLAYTSDQGSNRPEVYVQQFEGLKSGITKHWKVSSGGGGLPRWRSDGKELFFLTPNGRVMVAPVHANGEDLVFEAPVKLFQTRPLRKSWNLYDVSPDGQRFLINSPLEWALSSDIMVVTNWTEKLKD